jgi:hypothetical protein
MSSKHVDLASLTGGSNRSPNEISFGTIRADVPSVIAGLMAAGALLPEQMPAASAPWSPEKKLAAAVLASALTDIRVYHGRRSRQRQVAEALEWVQSDDTAWPFSFLRLCALFGLDSDWVRAAVNGWTRMPPHEREPRRITFRHAA